MRKKTLPKLVIFGDTTKGNVSSAVEEFAGFARGKAHILARCGIDQCTTDVIKDSDYAVVFGGDGTIISAGRQLSQSRVPVIGVNLGKLGFLAEFGVEELKRFFDQIIKGKVSIERRLMLDCRIMRDGQEKFRSAAINDIFITSGPPFRMIELRVTVDGQALAGFVSDGLIICTPTGSTAYNLSAGGPIVSCNIEAMVISAICPHSLSVRPVVINARSKVAVFGTRVNEGTTVSVDGQMSYSLSSADEVQVERHSSDFLVVNNPFRTEWDTLTTKLNWAEKPKYNLDNARDGGKEGI